MRIQFRIGDVEFHGVSFQSFEDHPAFAENWADRIVPGRTQLTAWDHVAQTWSRPVGRKRLKIAPGIQCFQLDAFGRRDKAAETTMLRRILEGLGVALPALKNAVLDSLPVSTFTFDAADAVPQIARRSESWQVFGQAQFEHFVVRFPVGRVNDWALLSVATDFTLSRKRIGQALPMLDDQTPPGQGKRAKPVPGPIPSSRRIGHNWPR